MARWIVLLEQQIEDEVPEGEGGGSTSRTWFELLGSMTVPKGTQRSTVMRRLLDEQGQGVPTITLGHADVGRVHLVPHYELEESVKIRGRSAIVFDRVKP